MPVTITKKSGGGYSVSTPNGVHAKNTTKAKAMAQRNLLNAVEHGWHPTGHPSKKDMAMKMRAASMKKQAEKMHK